MKELSELGISPAPWSADDYGESEHGEYDPRIRDSNDNEIAQPLSTFEDARLIAAAPELYECLREAVIEVCHNFKCCGSIDDSYSCNGDRECFVRKWREVLAKASGEEQK